MRSDPRRGPDGDTSGIVLDVVVPAFNEERRLPATLAGLRAALADLRVPAQVTVVDNGSTDRTMQVARDAHPGPVPIRVLSCPRRGKGHAVRFGMVNSWAPYVGFCDADLATGLEALPTVLALLDGGADAVIGSRAHPESVVAERHRATREAGAALFRAVVRPAVRSVGETQCGFKFFRGDLARLVFGELRTGGFAFDVEVLARAERYGARMVELPVSWLDVPGSRFSAFRDGWRSFLDVALIRARLAADATITIPAQRTARVRPALAPTGADGD